MSESHLFSSFALISTSSRLSVGYNTPHDSPLTLLRARSCGTLSKDTGFLLTFRTEMGSK